MTPVAKKWLPLLAALLVVSAAFFAWQSLRPHGPGEGFVSGNGRIEATEIDIATQLPGRVDAILVGEGEFVSAGQVLARMQIAGLQAQREEALARLQQSRHAMSGAQAQVALRDSDRLAAQAAVAQHEAELDAARRRLARSEALVKAGAASRQLLDDDRARVRSLEAAREATRAQVKAAEAAVTAARTQVVGAESSIRAAEASVARIDVELADSELKAPRDGRVQFLVAQPGEVLGAGGKILNLVDLSDVYMSFFLPETVAGRVALGSEVRIVLDVAPHFVIPAQISFVASVAQFTPKTVETASERQKLMFRAKARIDRELLLKYADKVKTGLPGVAWLKLDPEAEWPANLALPAER